MWLNHFLGIQYFTHRRPLVIMLIFLSGFPSAHPVGLTPPFLASPCNFVERGQAGPYASYKFGDPALY